MTKGFCLINGIITSPIANFHVHCLAIDSNILRFLSYKSPISGSIHTSVKGSVNRLWIEINTFGIVSPITQLCWRIESIPISPCRETFG